MRKSLLVPKGQREGAFIRTQRQRVLGGGACLIEAVNLTLGMQPALIGLARRELGK